MKRIMSAVIAVGLFMQPMMCSAEPTAAETTAENIFFEETVVPAESANTDTKNTEEEMEVQETPAPSIFEEATPAPTDPATQAPETQAPTADVSTTQAPTDSDIITVSSRAEIPAGAQVWTYLDGLYYCGKLEKIITFAGENAEIWLCQTDILEIKAVSLRHMASLRLRTDDTMFRENEYRVVVSLESPAMTEAPEELDLSQWLTAERDETADLFIWVEKIETEETPEPEQTPEPAPRIEVEAEDYRAAEWSNAHPTFRLSGIPDGKNWAYATVIYDERIAVLSENSYTAGEEGVYVLRFVILDELGDIVDASDTYTLYLDHTLPEVVLSVDQEVDYTLHIDMSDGMSGLSGLTLDGGASWIDLNGADSESYTVCEKRTFEAGMIQVRDVAGNTWISTERYELTKIPSVGSGGGSGDAGNSTAAKQHAAADENESGAEYDALSMQISDEPMHALNIDGQTLKLTLELANAEGFDIPEGYQPTFTAELAEWAEDMSLIADDMQPETIDTKKDTLILTAVTEENLGDRFEYRWKFNGEVYRLLANSGIRYLALQIGEDMAVFPTDGFVGGTKYTELKMLGISTRKFDYTVAMRFDLDPDRIPKLSESDFSENCDMAIQAEVENIKYVLSDEQKGEMYYYDAYLGPKDMMYVPYGAYKTQKLADEPK